MTRRAGELTSTLTMLAEVRSHMSTRERGGKSGITVTARRDGATAPGAPPDLLLAPVAVGPEVRRFALECSGQALGSVRQRSLEDFLGGASSY